MKRSDRRDPDQFDLFEPAHEPLEDGRGPYQQFLIAPPSELTADPGRPTDRPEPREPQ